MPLCPGRRATAHFIVFLGALLITTSAFAQGHINGVVKQKGGAPVGGAIVVLNERGSAEVTTSEGKYGFDRLAAGKYTLTITLGDHTATEAVTIAATPADLVTTVDWPLAFADTVTVSGVSKHVERIVESPAAVTRIDGADL